VLSFVRGSTVPRSLFLLTLLLLGVTPPAIHAGEKPWTEVRSPNFRVLTNGSANDGRRVAREFEQMREVFSLSFNKMRLDTGAPLLIFAPRDESAMKAMAPNFWKGGGPKPAGLFQHGWERQYAVIRLDQDVPGRNNIVYHEYVHTLLHANFRWLPTWLDEGVAEFYGNTRFEQTKMYVGAPSGRIYRLQNAQLIKLDELISENPWRKYKKDDERIDMFYSEAWALVHYLIFGPGMEQGKKLNKFYAALQQGEDQKKAFQDAFGDFKDVEDGLLKYARQFTFSTYVMENRAQINEKDFPSRLMSVGETEAELGTYRLFSHDQEEARATIEQALREDSGLALAHETLGFLDFADGKDEAAKTEFDKAYAADPQRYLSLYYATMLSPLRKSDALADESSLRAKMYDVLKVNPRFAPAFVELAMTMARQGNYTNALNLARRAEDLEPSRAGYHLLAGRILLALGRNDEAAKQATFVAERWRGPDRDEAIELLSALPTEKPALDATLLADALAGTQSSQGTVVSVTCAGKDGTAVVIQNADGTRTFSSGGAARMVGYSDTLWFGSDHFTMCHHLDGLRAVVRYKPSADKASAGEWVELELREDLPRAQEKSSTPPAAAKN
jgi:Tfp pilus assembly protein PilF